MNLFVFTMALQAYSWTDNEQGTAAHRTVSSYTVTGLHAVKA